MVVSFSCVFCGVGQAQKQESFRYWTTIKGIRSDVRLALIEISEDAVKLKREDNGKIITLPVKQLSALDRKYLIRSLPKDYSDSAQRDQKTDWPQWRGPKRDGKSASTGLLSQWPSGGPALAWMAEGLGEGYSTPSVSGSQLFVLGTKGNAEFVIALSTENGEIRWETKIGTKSGGGGYPGPRGTPTIDGDFVFAIGGEGALVCLKKDSGKRVWTLNLESDFSGKPGHWRYAESPLVDGNKVICTPGGIVAVVALNKTNGQPIWRSTVAPQGDESAGAAYASPIVADIQGTRQYIVFLHGGVVGIDAKSGQALWNYRKPANSTANCSTPVVLGDSVFAASGYGTGGGRVTITRQGSNWNVNEDYFVRKMESHHGGFLLHDGYIYGTNDSVLMCLDWDTGRIMWQDRCVGKGSIAYADGHLYVRSEGGDLALVEATPSGYREKGRFSQPQRSGKQAWPYPVIAGNRLYIHDQDRLLCFDVGESD